MTHFKFLDRLSQKAI